MNVFVNAGSESAAAVRVIARNPVHLLERDQQIAVRRDPQSFRIRHRVFQGQAASHRQDKINKARGAVITSPS